MNRRTRCREWLPLATQQLRLRNLVRISGVNIESGLKRALVYYTLHHTKETAAFYTSDPLPQPHFQLKWAEINCTAMTKSNANCVCVKVWARPLAPIMRQRPQETSQTDSTLQVGEPISALSQQLTRARLSPHESARPPDKLLFSWAVYFSGLILLSQEAGGDVKYQPNTLIFQINGDHFASPAHFNAELLREHLSLSYKRYAANVPRQQPGDSNDDAGSAAFSINSPRVSRSSSPVAVDWHDDLLRMPQTRYRLLHCAPKELRRSYNLHQLLHLQNLQRTHLQRIRDCHDLMADIKQLSVRCITKDELVRKRRRTARHQNHNQQLHHSMGRTLSVLLAEQQEIDPAQLLQAQSLQAQREQLHSRQHLLQSERDTYASRVAELRQRLARFEESRASLTAALQARQTQLSAQQQTLRDLQTEQRSKLHARREVVSAMTRRIAALCMELREIYPIGRNQYGYHTVCGIPFPSCDMYAHDYATTASANNSVEQVSPTALSASLGYVAHLVQMMAIVLHRPLRNPIVHEGSRSRILDVIKELPHVSREFPLYSRSVILPKPVQYAIYLLNQNIAQLCFDITWRRSDARGTIENILHIFTTLAEQEQQESSNAGISVHVDAVDAAIVMGLSALDGHHGNDVCLSKSNSSDMNHHVLSPPTLGDAVTRVAPFQLTKRFRELPSNASTRRRYSSERIGGVMIEERICRSVGSYSDCDEDVDGVAGGFQDDRHCYSNSDSNLTFKRGGHV